MSKKADESEPDVKNNNELTAEWTVRAKLSISGPGEKVTKEYTTNDPENPVRVTCKWTNLDEHETTKHTSEHFTDSGQCSPQKVCFLKTLYFGNMFWQTHSSRLLLHDWFSVILNFFFVDFFSADKFCEMLKFFFF